MGNSNGTLAEYWDAIESTPGLQGGFIWEFWDHGLVQTLPDGRTRWAYGGDFGDAPNDGNFVCDGMVWPDRRPKPAMWEHKRLAAPVRIGGDGRGPRTGPGRDRQPPALPRPRLAAGALLPDRRRHRDRRRGVRPAGARTGRAGDRRVARLGRADARLGRGVPDRSGHDRGGVGLGTAGLRGLRACRCRSGRAGQAPRPVAALAAGDGTVAARRRRPAPAPAPSPPRRPSRSGAPRPTTTGSAGWRRAGREAGVDRLERRLGRHRAPGRGDRRAQRLHDRGRHRRSRTRRPTRRSPTARSRSSRPSRSPTRSTTCRGSGPCSSCAPGHEALRWFGSGPHETYPDRKRGGLIGTLGVDRQRPVRPVHPSAGERRPRRRPLAGARATTAGAASGSSSTSPARSRSPTCAPPTSPRRPTTSTSSPWRRPIVHLDAAHRGLGTASCGPDTLPEYRLGPGTYRWGWTLRDLPRP